MKSIILNCVVLLFSCFICSQTAVKSNLDSGGASATVGNLQALYTIGETNVKEASIGPIMISEGFIHYGDLQIYDEFVLIPDPQFEQALIDQGIDSDGIVNGQLPRIDVLGVTILNISGYDITSFEGLQFFTSLLAFSHVNNQAITINSIDFSDNLALEDISIINAPNLAAINVSQNEFLQSLTVVTNNTLFNTIDVSNNFDLETLVLASNGLTTLNIDDNSLLTNLNVSNNPITSLDVSFLSQLVVLSLYETQIEILDVSSLVELVTVSAFNGSLKAVNLQNGGGNADNAQNVDLTGNPDLDCILVDSVAWAQGASGWLKDATASYFENTSINFTTLPGSISVPSDGTGNQTEFNAWLADNGGGVASTECGSVIWTYEILADDVFENTIEYIVEFAASTFYSGPDVTQASFTIETVIEAGEDNGSDGDLCSVVSYDLSNLIEINLQDSSIDSYRFEQDFVLPETPGVPDATFRGTEVDFPDTGAGSFTYTFRLIVEKTIDVYNVASGNYESKLFTDEALLTVNDVKIPFNPGPNQVKGWCPGTTLPTLEQLFEEFEIIDGIEFNSGLTFEPENYWFDSLGNSITTVSGPGDYIFNPQAFLPNCGAIPATVTVAAGKSAGISTSFDICPGTSLTEQDLIASLGADEGGNWTPTLSDPNNVSAGTYIYSHGDCTIGGDSTVTISLEQELFAGDDVLDAEDLSSYSCGDTVSFDLNTFRAVSADPGGKWYDSSNTLIANGITDFPDTGAGSFTEAFTYRQANDVCGFQPSEAMYEVTWNAGGLSAGASTSLNICAGSSVTEQDLLVALGADGGGNWSPTIDPFNITGGSYTYSHGNCSTGSDSTIEVIEFALSIDTEAQNLIVQFNPNGNETEIDAWLANNGGATASGCGNITWEWELIDFQLSTGVNPDDTFLECTIQFNAIDLDASQSGNSTALLKYEVFPSAGVSLGNGGLLCEATSYDLNQISSPNYNGSKFNTSNLTISQTGGFPGVSASGTEVDFPDTGAGQFSYYFDLIVTTPIAIGSTVNFDVESTASLTVDNVIIPFDPGPNITVELCDLNNVNLLDLYNELQIQLDVDPTEYNEADDLGYVFEPENLWYNETDDLEANPNLPPLTEITEPGVYQFNAKAFLQDCAGEPVFVTIVESCDITLNLKVFLQGAALNPNSGEENLMRDDLRVAGILPSTTPYEDKISCDPAVFNTSGPDAIVDWVWVELREQNNNTIIFNSRSALLQRDGDVVDIDGSSPLIFSIPSGNYYVSVNHRNHLGIMSLNAISFNALPVFIDFSNGSVSTFGNFAQTATGMPSNVLGMWAGDVLGNGQVRYLGPVNDTNKIKDNVLNPANGNPNGSNFYLYTAYDNADINMNGQVRYLGPGNDTNTLKDIVLSHPGNTSSSNFYPFLNQLPTN